MKRAKPGLHSSLSGRLFTLRIDLAVVDPEKPGRYSAWD